MFKYFHLFRIAVDVSVSFLKIYTLLLSNRRRISTVWLETGLMIIKIELEVYIFLNDIEFVFNYLLLLMTQKEKYHQLILEYRNSPLRRRKMSKLNTVRTRNVHKINLWVTIQNVYRDIVHFNRVGIAQVSRASDLWSDDCKLKIQNNHA